MESVGVGLLGLGTVGGAVARRLIDRVGTARRAAPARHRCCAALRCATFRALATSTSRTSRLGATRQAVVADPGVAIVIEAIGWHGSRDRPHRVGAARRQDGRHREQGGHRDGRSASRRARGGARRGAVFRGGRRRRGCRSSRCSEHESARRPHLLARLRHQRHHQRHPHEDASARARLRGGACGRAAAGVRRGGSDARRRRVGRAHKLVDPLVAGDGRARPPGGRSTVSGSAASAPRTSRRWTSSGIACASLAHAERAHGGAVHLQVRPTAIGRGTPRCTTSMMQTMLSSSRATSPRASCFEDSAPAVTSTASAVVSDVVNAVRDRRSPARPGRQHALHMPRCCGDEDVEVAGYVRLRLACGSRRTRAGAAGARGQRPPRRRRRRPVGSTAHHADRCRAARGPRRRAGDTRHARRPSTRSSAHSTGSRAGSMTRRRGASSPGGATGCRLPPDAPRISLGEGGTPCVESADDRTGTGPCIAALQARGFESDRLLQGPRHGGRGGGGVARGEPRDHLRVHGQHQRIGGRVRRAVRAAHRRRGARRAHRVGQAAPGASAWSEGGEHQRRVRCGAARRARGLRLPSRHPGEQRQPEPDRRAEDGRIRDRRRAR